jgi:glycosyltransferase involved in cell wall biosynthesis
VLSQTHAEVELIVVDYGSTDDTDRIVADYPQARYLRRPDGGIGSARNDGLAASAGEFVLFLDADDKLVPDALETSAACLEAHPDCAFAYGHMSFFDDSGPAQHRGAAPRGCLVDDDPYAWMLRMNNPLRIPGAVLYRRPFLEEVGGFATDLAITQDLDLNMRLARVHPICCNDHVVLEQRLHDSHVSTSRRWRQGLADAVAAQRRQRAYVGEHPFYEDDYRNGLRVARSYWGGHLAEETITLLAAGSFQAVVRNLVTLTRWHPAGLLGLVARMARRASQRLQQRGS